MGLGEEDIFLAKIVPCCTCMIWEDLSNLNYMIHWTGHFDHTTCMIADILFQEGAVREFLPEQRGMRQSRRQSVIWPFQLPRFRIQKNFYCMPNWFGMRIKLDNYRVKLEGTWRLVGELEVLLGGAVQKEAGAQEIQPESLGGMSQWTLRIDLR